jgi:hypothetical protein
MNPRLAIFGYSEAAMFLRATPMTDVAAVISIHGRREFGVEAEVRHRLDLAFDDVDVAAPGDEMGLLRLTSRRRWADENGLVEVAPDADDAAKIIAFAEAVRETDGVVLSLRRRDEPRAGGGADLPYGVARCGLGARGSC